MADAAQQDTVLEATGNKARLARVYAEALLAAATKAGSADAIGDELYAVADSVVAGHPLVSAFFDSAAISRKGKVPVLVAAFAKHSSALFQQFVGVLNQNGRLGLLREIARTYRTSQDRLAGRVRVRVTSATPLNEAQTEKLRGTLTTALKKEPILNVTVDPNLLGGLVVQVGDRVYDTSVRTRLDSIRTHLLSSGTNVVQA